MKSQTYEKHFPKLSAEQLAENGTKKVICGMSGGVDSSGSAFILQQQGYQVEGLFMKNWEEDDDTDYCTAAADLADAQAVCDKLGIKLHKINFAAEYWDNVFEHFLNEYKAGRTPNPDILCNKEIKFKAFLEYAAEDLGANYIATGHYVRRRGADDNAQSLRGLDVNKDQSYFLANIDPAALEFMLFPLGEMYKKDVKEAARAYAELSQIASASESSEICFVDTTYIDVLKRHTGTKMPGIVRDRAGNAIGTHEGYMHYTIGKRRGFTVHGAHEPHFVLSIDPSKNEIVVGGKDELATYEFDTENFNAFLSRDEILNMPSLGVKIRYRSAKLPVKISPREDGGVHAVLSVPAAGIAPAQLAVFYDERDRVVASGFIK